MGFLDDLFLSSSNGNVNGNSYIATKDGYNDAKDDLVARYNAGKSIDYSDPDVKRVLTAFEANDVEQLRHKLNL